MSTRAFERLESATRADYQAHILTNELLSLLAAGAVTLDHYIAYLRETYHLVRQTSRSLAKAASFVEDEHRQLRAWLIRQAAEEHGHELLCIADLRYLGANPDAVLSAKPGPGAWGLITQNYYLAARYPVGLVGVASATEQMGAELASAISVTVGEKLKIPNEALTFLRSHSSFDVRHFDEARKAVDEFGEDLASFDWIVFARKSTFRNYGLMFSDIARTIPPKLPRAAA